MGVDESLCFVERGLEACDFGAQSRALDDSDGLPGLESGGLSSHPLGELSSRS